MQNLSAPREPTLLVVDDEPEIRATLVAAFRRVLPHVRVVTAEDAEDALERLADQKFDLVLSDHCMPGMQGLDFLARAKDMQPGCSRVLMTGHPELTLAVRGINDRVLDRFLTKPFRPLEAASMIGALLEERAERQLQERAFSRSFDLLQRKLAAPAPSDAP